MIEDAAFYDDCSLQLASQLQCYASKEHHKQNVLVYNKGKVRPSWHSQENDVSMSHLDSQIQRAVPGQRIGAQTSDKLVMGLPIQN